MTNKERRNAQMAYITDEEIWEEQKICRKKLQQLNFMDRSDFEGIRDVIKDLFGKSDGAFVNPPFYCDYGKHNVAIYTAGHPIHPVTRNSGYEYGKEVVIGDNVWIGGNSVVCPGVHIGDHVVIGAGSVVTKDIPDWSVAAGNPCRVIRAVTEEDRQKLFRGEKIDREAWADIAGRMTF